MKTYNVTVYNETFYGAIIPEQKVFKAADIEMLYEILKTKGYKRYFIGSFLEPAYEN